MIVQCPDCTTRYELDASRVPAGRVRVRCARCRYVFPIEALAASSGARTPIAADPGITQDAWSSGAARPVTKPVAVEPLRTTARADSREVSPVEPMTGMESTRIELPAEPMLDAGLDLEIERPSATRGTRTATVEELPATATVTEAPEPAVAAEDETDRKAKRLARALVSDILVYNRDKRDAALADGKLVQALGTEIKKSWELYKERVTPEVATSSNHFKEALNEILAEGQKIF